jgi:O-antigen/teichoic acid export membrane protein
MAVQAREARSRRLDYLSTFATEGLFILSYLFVFRVVADHFGPRGFGEYALARRTLAFLLPIGAVGLDVAIARFVAYSVGRPKEQRSFLPAALGLMAIAVAIQGTLLIGFQSFWAGLFFGSEGFTDLVPPLVLMVAGNALFAVAYGNFRGHLRITSANGLRILVHALFPFLAVLLVRGSVAELLYVIGAGWAVLSIAALAVTPMSLEKPLARASELAKYSVPRVPGDLLALILFAIPGIIVAHVADITVAGEVAFGIAAIGMIASAVFPAGFILLPVASRLLAAGSVDRLRSQVFGVARVVIALILVGILIFEVFAGPIITIYLGRAFEGSVTTLRILMLGALPWGIYISLRSVIDARHKRPLNAINVAIAFAVFGILMLSLQIWFDVASIVVPVFVLSLYVLGILTSIEVWRITRAGAPAGTAMDFALTVAAEESVEPMV